MNTMPAQTLETSAAAPLILSIGGGAGKIISMINPEAGSEPISRLHLDTHAGDLAGVAHAELLLLGQDSLHGQGTGGLVDRGEQAASRLVAELRPHIERAGLVLVLACLGGGTGSGAIRIVARLVREMKRPAFYLVTLPFASEGNGRREVATAALTHLQRQMGLVIPLPNDILFSSISTSGSLDAVFPQANCVVAESVVGLVDAVSNRGVLPVDYADFRAVLEGKECFCSLGCGYGIGENRVQDVVDTLFQSTTLGNEKQIQRANVVLGSLRGSELTMDEMNACLAAFHARLGKATHSFIGVSNDKQAAGLRFTLLTVHYKSSGIGEAAPSASTSSGGKTVAKRKGRGKTLFDTRQGKLPLLFEDGGSLGIFANAPLTHHGAECLDIPTHLRRHHQEGLI